MSSINLTGTLLNSIGEVDVGAVITWTHLSNTGETIATTKSDTVIPPDGAYNINLEYGRIRVDYRTENTERFVAEVVVNNESTATTIPELLNAFVPDGDGQGPAPFLMEDATDAERSFSVSVVISRSTSINASSFGGMSLGGTGPNWLLINEKDIDGNLLDYASITGGEFTIFINGSSTPITEVITISTYPSNRFRLDWPSMGIVSELYCFPVDEVRLPLVDGDSWVRDNGRFVPKQAVLKSSIQPSITNSIGGDEQTKINEILVAMRLFGVIET